MVNLLVETLEALADNGRSPHEVIWVGSRDGKIRCRWGEFTYLADFEYHDRYGGIPFDLVVCGEGWWLERHEHDGEEHWVHRLPPGTMFGALPVLRLRGDCSPVTLAEIHDDLR
jgi:hypothetical protein